MHFILAQAGTGIIDKTLDTLFSSPPALIVFFVMIVALVSIPVFGYQQTKTIQKMQSDFGTQQTQLTNVIATLTKTLESSQNHANNAQEENADNYLSIRTFFDQQRDTLLNMAASLKESSGALLQHVADVTNLHAQTRAELKTNLNNRLAEAVETSMSQRRIELFDTFQVPDDNDCRYKMKIVKTAPDLTTDEILLYKAPVFKDGNEAGRLRGSGEVVNIIIDIAFPSWCYIKQVYGDKPLAGYARKRTVAIMDLPDLSNSKES